MTSFFLDLNVWFALSVEGHGNEAAAWDWLEALPDGQKLIFCRQTHLGLIRLLTNRAAMARRVMNLGAALDVYQAWQDDPRVEFFLEPRDLSQAFRTAAEPFKKTAATNMVADCYLLAFAKESGAVLVTFDAALQTMGVKRGYEVIRLT